MDEKITTFRGEYQFLSNMYTASFEWDGRQYKNSEAAFQSAKTLDPSERNAFSDMNGVTAKRAGRKVALRADWEQVKDSIMEEVVEQKFVQNPELLKKLVDTGEAELVEGNNWHDRYWGVDLRSGEGENHLGRILMKVRDAYRTPEDVEKTLEKKRQAEEAERQKKQDVLDQIRETQAAIDGFKDVDFTGMECRTKAFGTVTIKRQEGNYLYFDARGTEKSFVLPGSVLQGFMFVDDPAVLSNLQAKKDLQDKMKLLLEEAKKLGIEQ